MLLLCKFLKGFILARSVSLPSQWYLLKHAYDLWNFAYVYNCIPDHSFYSGAMLLLSCTIPAFFIKKGAWLQHRAQTLALASNVAVFIYHFSRIKKNKLNPLKDEIYKDLKGYKEIVTENK